VKGDNKILGAVLNNEEKDFIYCMKTIFLFKTCTGLLLLCAPMWSLNSYFIPLRASFILFKFKWHLQDRY